MIIRLDPRLIGKNFEVALGFSLGLLPGGGYGVKWERGPDGLGQRRFWVAWDHPHDPLKFEFEEKEFVFCLESAGDDEIQNAPVTDFQSEVETR